MKRLVWSLACISTIYAYGAQSLPKVAVHPWLYRLQMERQVGISAGPDHTRINKEGKLTRPQEEAWFGGGLLASLQLVVSVGVSCNRRIARRSLQARVDLRLLKSRVITQFVRGGNQRRTTCELSVGNSIADYVPHVSDISLGLQDKSFNRTVCFQNSTTPILLSAFAGKDLTLPWPRFRHGTPFTPLLLIAADSQSWHLYLSRI